jgi:hypothetical protein
LVIDLVGRPTWGPPHAAALSTLTAFILAVAVAVFLISIAVKATYRSTT